MKKIIIITLFIAVILAMFLTPADVPRHYYCKKYL